MATRVLPEGRSGDNTAPEECSAARDGVSFGMARCSLFALSFLLLASCATGADGEQDGVITGGDARADRQDDEDTSGDDADVEDTGTTSAVDSGGAKDSGSSDTGRADTGTADSGKADTGATDTKPATCSGEEPEPNGTPATARVLGAIDDCDGSGSTVSGVLSSSTDVDVLSFEGTDSFGCSVNPVVVATGPVTVCIRAVCKSGTTELKSCKQGTKTGDECCGSTVEAELNCTGTASDDTTITITVRSDGAASTCESYSLAYHY